MLELRFGGTTLITGAPATWPACSGIAGSGAGGGSTGLVSTIAPGSSTGSMATTVTPFASARARSTSALGASTV